MFGKIIYHNNIKNHKPLSVGIEMDKPC